MEHILLAVVPIFLFISLGFFLKKIKLISDKFWKFADKFTYYIFFPSLLIYKLSNVSIENIDAFIFILSAIIAIIMISVVLFIINQFAFFFQDSSFTSVYQGSLRFNTYLFLALTNALYGDEGLVLASLLIVFLIPVLNILCITVFAIYNPSEKISFESFIKSIITNPLIMACVFASSLNYFEISLIKPLENSLSLLSLFALPLGLLLVGVGFHFTHIKEVKFALFTSVFIKLALFPAIVFFTAHSMGVGGLGFFVLMLFSTMPTTPSSYILARELGGDLNLMSAIITMQTLLSLFTISIIMIVLES